MESKFKCYVVDLDGSGEYIAEQIEAIFKKHPKIADWATDPIGDRLIVYIWLN